MSLRVDWRAPVGLLGTVLTYLSVPLTLPLLVGLYYGRDAWVFGATVGLAVLAGRALARVDTDPDLGTREGFLFVGMTWLAVAAVGAVPYLLAGQGSASTLAQPVNALFESTSGFTTTGATVMGEISTERHSRAVLLWRQLTQWLGGMGIVVLMVAVLPELSVGGAQLVEAEAPGPGVEKLTPRIQETARVLWLFYLGFTLVEALLLYGLHLAGLAPGMGPYSAVAHALTTLPTGGFSPAARSLAAFSAAVQWVVIPFMVVAGTNFALFWALLRGNPRAVLRDREFRAYLGVVGALTAVLGAVLFAGGSTELAGRALPALRHALFQAVSIVTTTGYASVDFDAWGPPAKVLLLVAMFVGGSAGSTGGGIKVVRWLVIAKSIRRELFSSVHPEAVTPVRLGPVVVDERAIRGIYGFTLLYVALFFIASGIVAVDAARVGLDAGALAILSAVASTLGNVGPGFGLVGPMESYRAFPATTKLLFVFLMWAGRLEILPVLVLLTPGYWRS